MYILLNLSGASPRLLQAVSFARAAHDSIGQVRKYTNEPYWVHTEDVATRVRSVGGDEDMIIAALFHDILEDVFPKNPIYSPDLIKSLFGERVLNLVIELTDVYTSEAYPNKNRKERKQLERERVGRISIEGKTIKLADLISNTYSIVEHDEGFAKTYIREKEEALPYLIEGNTRLLIQAGEQVIEAKQKLGMFMPKIEY